MTSLEAAPAVSSRTTAFTALPPSCVLFTPDDPELIAVGTYYLDESASTAREKKTGSLELYHKDGLRHLQSVPTQAVLDIKFSPHTPSLLAAAQSLGLISLFALSSRSDAGARDLSRTKDLRVVDADEQDDALVLALAFSPTDPDLLAFTLSTGEVGLLSLHAAQVVHKYRAHDLEAWTCEFSPDGSRLYSGGDDSAFCCHDVRSQMRLFRDRKTHGAGVTAILARQDGTLVTGSYDDVLRVWDGDRRVVGEMGLGGGVWRLLEMREGVLLASCMHAGARVVETGEGEGKDRKLGVRMRFEEHQSMNYGSHWHRERPEDVVSCSFYDKRLCLWPV